MKRQNHKSIETYTLYAYNIAMKNPLLNNSESNEKVWTNEETEAFYADLLSKALETIPETGAAMVLGPMFILRTPEENFTMFTTAQNKLTEKGIATFNQLPFVDYVIVHAPYNYATKFEVFYKGLIESGKISACYLLPDWEKSAGTVSEIEYCKKAGVPVYKMTEIE